MINDTLTIVWKEYKELFSRRGRLGGIYSIVIMLLVFGIWLPVTAGTLWVESPSLLVYWVWVPFFLVANVVADSFAGERERHTLETLLSTRISDTAIVLGKLTATISYGWGITMLAVVVSLITVNITHPGPLLFYPRNTAVAIILVSLLGSGLVAAVGVLISLRSATVRLAQQTLGIGVLAVVFIPLIVFSLIPENIQEAIVVFALTAGPDKIMLMIIAGLLVVDTGLIILTLRRFKRDQLILD